jgi:hypothetical protein
VRQQQVLWLNTSKAAMVMSHLFKLDDTLPAYPLSIHFRSGSVMLRSLASFPLR